MVLKTIGNEKDRERSRSSPLFSFFSPLLSSFLVINYELIVYKEPLE